MNGRISRIIGFIASCVKQVGIALSIEAYPAMRRAAGTCHETRLKVTLFVNSNDWHCYYYCRLARGLISWQERRATTP